MSLLSNLVTIARLTVLAATARATAAKPQLVHASDGSGVYGYADTPVLPWCGFRVHDADRPVPKRIDVGPGPDKPAPPPSDAIMLFDGKGLPKWQKSDWKLVTDQSPGPERGVGLLEAGDGKLATKENFGNSQIHVEWMAPAHFQGPWYNQGNNGVFLMGLYEIQIFDSYDEKIYPDGMAGAVYGQTPPLVDACRPPGQWQAFDILFTAPVFEGNKLVRPARVTVLQNGVLVQLNQEIHGETVHRALPAYNQKVSQGPLVLSGHSCPVRFRNIWLRPLP